MTTIRSAQEDAESPSEGTTSGAEPDISDRLALWLFVAFLVTGGLLILFHYGVYHWFFRDDFVFLADRQGRYPDLLTPYGGAHWVAIPRLIYFVVWQVFGLTSYVPYQACVVALHLTVAVLLRTIMRRSGVDPWLATAAASLIVLFGPGSQNIVWAFQVSFTGSLAYGLAHLVLADNDDGFGRRDLLGVFAGALGLMSSAVGVTMVGVVGLAVLLKRGWRMAFLHTAPLAAFYGLWVAVEHPVVSNDLFGRPSFEVLSTWVRNTETATFMGLGHFQVVAVLFAVILLGGLVLLAGPKRGADLATLRRRLAVPVALFVGGLVFATTTGYGRWWNGEQAARASRYVYLGAAFTLPLLAVATQAVARRWRMLTPALVGLLLLPIPFNVAGFKPVVFTKDYMDQRRYILTTAVRMPFANDVPADVQPLPDPFASNAVTMGFLRGAKRNGDLDVPTGPLRPGAINEFKVRLGVAGRPVTGPVGPCRAIDGNVELSPRKGEVFVIRGPVNISTRDGNRPSGPQVQFSGDPAISELTIELDGLDLLVSAARGVTSKICEGT